MQALEYACQDVINTLLDLSDHDPDQPLGLETIQDDLHERFERMKATAASFNCQPDDIQAAQYALVALADELIPREVASLSDDWRNAMQQRYYGENLAGDGFFRQLASILADPRRAEVGRIYALCLTFGFRGKYAVRGTAQLQQQRQYLRERLGLSGAPFPLSPRVARPKEAHRNGNLGMPMIWLGAFFVVFSIALVTMFRWQLDKKSLAISRSISVSESSPPPAAK